MPIALIASFVIQALPYVIQELGVIGMKGSVPDDVWNAFKASVENIPADDAWKVTEPDV